MHKGKLNKGYLMEQKMCELFKGTPCDLEEVDFETDDALYEVKSCNLLLPYSNRNDLRDFKHKRNRSKLTYHLGRFRVKTDNHISLFLRAVQSGKVPQYIFVLRIREQFIYKVVQWHELGIANDKDFHPLKVQDIFYRQ